MQRASFRDLFSIDIRSLALFRIGLALLILCDLVERAKEIIAHYTDAGVLPYTALTQHVAAPPFSLHFLDGGATFQIVLFGVAIVLSLMLLIGWRTRWTAGLSYLLLLSLQQRNLLLVDSGDSLERFLLLWAFFLPLGAYAAIGARWPSSQSRPTRVLSAASVALLLQPLAMYIAATVSKLQSDAWLEGRALYAILNKTSYVRPFGEYLLGFPELVTFLSYSTIVIEGLLPLLLLSPWWTTRLRIAAITLNAVFHGGIWLCLDIGYFQPLAVLSLIPYLPSSLWNRFPRFSLREPAAHSEPVSDHSRTRVMSWAYVSNGVAGLLLTFVVASNVLSLSPVPVLMPEPLYSVGKFLHIHQQWRMFGHTDGTPQGWFIVVGRLKDGPIIDVLNRRLDVSFERPENYADSLPNKKWRNYWSKIIQPRYAVFRPYLADYFCRQWNDEASPELQLYEVEIIHMREIAYDPKQPKQIIPQRVIHKSCMQMTTADEM